jgi:rhodanese-related sulfurtransferase
MRPPWVPPFPDAVAPGFGWVLCRAAAYNTQATDVQYAESMLGELTPQQVAELLSRGDLQLIDVRERHEHEAGRIPGSRSVALAELPAHAPTIDPDRPVVCYCRSGARSAVAAEALRGAGLDAHNMTGGLLEWAAAGLPLEPDGGCVADG